VKGRAYAGDRGALYNLMLSIETFCALFAPFMPFITEEVWQAQPWRGTTSVHTQSWPTTWPDFANGGFGGNIDDYKLLCDLVSFVRGEKSKNNFSMKKPIAKLTVAEFFRASETDIKNVLNVTELEFSGGAIVGELVWGE
ncbi:MAG: class I tRNA ligase family protein, partial [Proteobacteria bacterium]|nr:class I tRNA ligase family protein [Pseudomonadota bacterium]